jgi:hypothetical protein
MERRSTAITEARAEAAGPVILLDTGNFSTGRTTEIERLKAEHITRAMALIGYDAVNVGKMDARRPRLGVREYDQTGCPLISAGYTYEDEETGERRFSFPSRIVVEREGFRIGIVGHPFTSLGEEDSESLGFENEATVDPRQFYELLDEAYVKDRVGMIILITDFAGSWQEAHFAAGRYPLAAVAIAGSAAEASFTDDKEGSQVPHPVVVPRAASWGRSLGILDLDLSPTGGVTAYRLKYVDLNENVAKDPALAKMTAEYLEAIDKEPTEVLQVRMPGLVGAEACRSCHGGEYESWAETRHAQAWGTLEKSGRLQEASCVPCHATGYPDAEALPARIVPREAQGVGCEACHGPGEVHILFQRWRLYGESTGEVHQEDLTDPIVLIPPQETCTRCHVGPYDEGWVYEIKLDRVRHD